MRPARLLLAVPLFLIYPTLLIAQTGPGCGPANVKFDVTTTKSPHPSSTLPSGKALVYFLQDDVDFGSVPRPTTRFGVDGAWVGATHANSYFYVPVDPGEHHLCASWQSLVTFATKRSTAAIHLSAEAGKTYYFRAQDITKMGHSGGENDTEYVKQAQVVLQPLDPDEAQVLLNSFSFSSSRAKQ